MTQNNKNEDGKKDGESQLQVAIGLLLDTLIDKDLSVVETTMVSLRKLAETHTNAVLHSCCHYCKRNAKLTNEHLASILRIMEMICVDHLINIDGDTILATLDLALEMLMRNQGANETIIQAPASGVLVALGRKHHIQVIDALLSKIDVGNVPHPMIAHTLGTLSNVNAYGVVPYLKNILSLILPQLAAVRADSLKEAFSYALGSFCDALLEYTANIEQAPDNTITINNYQVEIAMVYDVLFGSWVHSRDSKVVESILNALSAIFVVLNVEKVTQQTPKIVTVLLNFYKKSYNSFVITKCLYAVIQKAASVNGTLLEPLLTPIFQHVSELLCISPDYAQPEFLKTHSEILRCYECFALHFTDHTIDHLIGQLKNNNEREKIKGLLVITHLVSYLNEQTIQRRFKDILKHLNELLNDPHPKVKKALLKVVVAFSNKGIFLDREINPDGPDKYMEFILKLCCKPTSIRITDQNQEWSDLQKSADNTLCMLSTSVPELEVVLWRLLMDRFLGCHYEEATVVLLRCLTYLATRKITEDSCEGAFVRCLALLAMPLNSFRGTFILNFLKNIKPCKSDEYSNVWDTKIPQLIKYLEQNYDHFNQTEWQDLVFDFLSILLETVNNEDFNKELITAARKQLDIYNDNRQQHNGSGENAIKQIERHFLLKCIAKILCFIKEKEIVLKTLDNILVNVRLTDYTELHACSESIGICSRTHLQLVLDKLSMIRKDVLIKKTSKFLHFPFIKDQKHELGVERVRYVTIASYSEICRSSISDKLLRVIESEILDFVVTELGNSKDFPMRKICLKAIGSVADAMHPDRNPLHIRMNDRDHVLEQVSTQIQLHSGPEYIELFPVIFPVVTSLIRLPPVLEFELRSKLLRLTFETVFNASAIYCRISAEDPDNYYGDLKLVPYVTGSFTKINQLVQEILLQDVSPAVLDEIVGILSLWLDKRRAEQRLPAIETLRIVLQTYLDNMKFAYDSPSSFGQTGSLLAKIVPRCTDPNKNIRKVAVECLCLVLCISSRYEGHMRDHDKVLSNSFNHIQHQIESDEPKLLYNLTSDIAHIIGVNLPHFQVSHLVYGLIDALMDCESSSSNGSSVVLNIILKNRGNELATHVEEIMDKILNKLRVIKCPRTRSSSLRGVLNFAVHHPKIIGNFLVAQPLPFDNSVCDCWSILSTDPTLIVDLLDQLKKIIKQSTLFDEQANGEIRVATLQPLQAVSVLHEIFKNSQLKDICIQQFAELFTLLLVTIASYIGTAAPAIRTVNDKKDRYGFILNRDGLKLKPARIALDTFKLFLSCCDYNPVSNRLLGFTDIEDDNNLATFLQMVDGLSDVVASNLPQTLSWLAGCCGPYIRAESERQRIAVVAFFAFLLEHEGHDQAMLAENLLEMLLDVQNDSCMLVRRLALQGLGYGIQYLNVDLIARHSRPIMGALLDALDYNSITDEAAVVLEGMRTFSKLLRTLKGEKKLVSCQVTTVVRLKPLLEQDDVDLREAAFRLFGDLADSFDTDANGDAFKEQIKGNLVTLLVHLCDPELEIVKATKYTLRNIGVHLEAPRVNAMFQEHLIEEANLNFNDFIKDLIKIMAEELQDLFDLLLVACLTYLKSNWPTIRGSAAYMAGLLYSYSHTKNKHRAQLDTVCDKLMKQLNDESADVRKKVIESIVLLFAD